MTEGKVSKKRDRDQNVGFRAPMALVEALEQEAKRRMCSKSDIIRETLAIRFGLLPALASYRDGQEREGAE